MGQPLLHPELTKNPSRASVIVPPALRRNHAAAAAAHPAVAIPLSQIARCPLGFLACRRARQNAEEGARTSSYKLNAEPMPLYLTANGSRLNICVSDILVPQSPEIYVLRSVVENFLGTYSIDRTN